MQGQGISLRSAALTQILTSKLACILGCVRACTWLAEACFDAIEVSCLARFCCFSSLEVLSEALLKALSQACCYQLDFLLFISCRVSFSDHPWTARLPTLCLQSSVCFADVKPAGLLTYAVLPFQQKQATNNPSLLCRCRKRYAIFKTHYAATLRLKNYFPFTLIDAMGSIEETRQQITKELRWDESSG